MQYELRFNGLVKSTHDLLSLALDAMTFAVNGSIIYEVDSEGNEVAMTSKKFTCKIPGIKERDMGDAFTTYRRGNILTLVRGAAYG